MAASLQIGDTTYELPGNLHWRDEYQWEPVAQERERALDGSLHVHETPRQAGRPVTLTGAWAQRSLLETLREQALPTTDAMTLTLEDGRTFTVRWRRGDGPALEAEPVHPLTAPPEDHLYKVTLRFLTA